ncbi:hypothetical protein ACOME3_007696 [Neoechinorhynchus agilis]
MHTPNESNQQADQDQSLIIEQVGRWTSDAHRLIEQWKYNFIDLLSNVCENSMQFGFRNALRPESRTNFNPLACGSQCRIYETNLWRARIGEPFRIKIEARDVTGRRRSNGGDTLDALVESINGSNSHFFPERVLDHKDGTYSIFVTFNNSGLFSIIIVINGRPMRRYPLIFRASMPRIPQNFNNQQNSASNVDNTVPIMCSQSIAEISNNSVVLGISCRTSEERLLCRPWGVCCDPEGNIFVGDRLNNSIKIFDKGMKLLLSIGTLGVACGYFNRPCGVAIDTVLKRLLVVDKDNHRVQIFSMDRIKEFISQSRGDQRNNCTVIMPSAVIGSRGFGYGQFSYPYDVAVSQESKIAVTDTMNYRIQLFDENGQYIGKFGGGDKNGYTQITPRGVTFSRNNKIIVTDFDRHRIIVLNTSMEIEKTISAEGDTVGCLNRPQGVDVDMFGNIYVADSRNYRIQIFDQNGVVQGAMGKRGNRTGNDEMDLPCDICISSSGSLLVIDSGNNRLLSFQ